MYKVGDKVKFKGQEGTVIVSGYFYTTVDFTDDGQPLEDNKKDENRDERVFRNDQLEEVE